MFRVTRIYKRSRANKLAKRELLKCSLIALLIGAIGTGGSFAWFKSNAEVKSNLKVETGTIKVGIFNGDKPIENGAIKVSGLPPKNNNKVDNIFSIKNTGSLNQTVKLYFKYTGGIKDSEFLSKINYDITYETKGDIQSTYKECGTMDKLIDKENPLIPKYINQKAVILKPKEEVICTFESSLNNAINNKYSGKSVNFDLIVDANQVNKK